MKFLNSLKNLTCISIACQYFVFNREYEYILYINSTILNFTSLLDRTSDVNKDLSVYPSVFVVGLADVLSIVVVIDVIDGEVEQVRDVITDGRSGGDLVFLAVLRIGGNHACYWFHSL